MTTCQTVRISILLIAHSVITKLTRIFLTQCVKYASRLVAADITIFDYGLSVHSLDAVMILIKLLQNVLSPQEGELGWTHSSALHIIFQGQGCCG